MSNNRPSLARRWALSLGLGGLLCGVVCMLPMLAAAGLIGGGVVLGIDLCAVGGWVEVAAVVLITAGAALAGFAVWRRRASAR